MERTRGFTCHLDKGRVCPTRVQLTYRHHWHCDGGRRIPHRLAFIIATFGIGLLFMWLPITLVGLWFVYRIVRGWVTLGDSRPMYV
jgi:uncharacterized membrane protein